jgi:hypothetical protein
MDKICVIVYGYFYGIIVALIHSFNWHSLTEIFLYVHYDTFWDLCNEYRKD